jgi:G2/mitotic-specific cyclin-B, other
MKNQDMINDSMRAVLIDWLMEVHLKFELLPETLFLCVNLIDRYLNLKKVDKTQFQLLGVSAMLIASKYEEIYAPEVRDFIYATNKTYSGEDILRMEYSILSSLNFETLHFSAFRFLERFHFISNDQGNHKCFLLAQYFIELNLLDYDMIKYPASLQAACALYLARKILKIDPANNWSSHLISQTGYSEKDLQDCLKDIVNLIPFVLKSKVNTVLKKFQLDEYKRVAYIIYDKIVAGDKDTTSSSSSR